MPRRYGHEYTRLTCIIETKVSSRILTKLGQELESCMRNRLMEQVSMGRNAAFNLRKSQRLTRFMYEMTAASTLESIASGGQNQRRGHGGS